MRGKEEQEVLEEICRIEQCRWIRLLGLEDKMIWSPAVWNSFALSLSLSLQFRLK